MGAQKNPLNKMILLSTHNIVLEDQIIILECTKPPLGSTVITFSDYKKNVSLGYLNLLNLYSIKTFEAGVVTLAILVDPTAELALQYYVITI